MLFRKMLRDMKQHKAQFVSIFLMAFLGAFIYAGIGSEWVGLRQTSDDYYKTTNLSDVWLFGKNFADKDAAALKTISGITATERRLVLDATADLSGSPSVKLYITEKNEISKPYLVEGEAFGPDAEGIWLDKRFCDARDLSLGDSITLSYGGRTWKEEVKGILYSPEAVYLSDGDGITPDFSQNAYAYLSYKQFSKGADIPFTQLLLKTSEKDKTALENRISQALGGNYSVFLTRENHPSYSMFQNEVDQHRSMGEIFPLAFLAIALLTMLTTMTRIVNNQRTQIGTLKALGYRRRGIALHYIGYGFWLTLTGSVLGTVMGPLTLPWLFYPSMSSFYTLPRWQPALDPNFLLMPAVTVALSVLVTFLSCRIVLRDTPATTLRPKAPKVSSHGVLEKTKFWHHLDFYTKWNLRDIFRNKVRSTMAVVGVLGCTMLLVCAFGMYDVMGNLKTWQYETINRFASRLSVDPTATKEQINRVMDAVDGQLLMDGSAEIEANGVKKTGSATVTDNITLIHHTDATQNEISLPENGVSLSYKMANLLGVKKGDSIRWHLYGDETWVISTVAEIYRHPTSQGITLTRSHFESLGLSFAPTAIVTAKEVRSSYDGIIGIQNTGDLTDGWNDMTEAMMTMVYLLIMAAAVLAVVVLYNLGILSLTEMERGLATLKVMGFRTRKLRRLLLIQNLWLSAVGFLLGVPSGKILVDVMIATMGDSFDMSNVISLSNILLSFVIVLALSLLVNRMFYKKIRHIDMVSALKGVE